MSRNTQLTKGVVRDLATNGLPAASLDIVRDLAAEGCREHAIRRTLGLSPSQWNALKKDDAEGELSPLALAMEEGRAEGAGEVIAVMRARMKEGDTRAAEWLGDKLYKIGREDGPGEAPRVLIQINAALSPEEYARVIHVQD
ncbi:hypothetical protein [Methylobacillus flagellatus]|uniref:hypothetical protein n=1 Tax=Methylobacillus flagellatus TaxID=405 RepID=UPI0010FA06C2|nr:hypothetical protein [Methylobacillus flagellatus]